MSSADAVGARQGIFEIMSPFVHDDVLIELFTSVEFNVTSAFIAEPGE